MKFKKRKIQREQGRQFVAVILCCDPVLEALIKQLLPSEFFVVKNLPPFEADLCIFEEGLLTPMERKILRTLVELGTAKSVAEHLHYHPTTVKRCLKCIYKKLGGENRPTGNRPRRPLRLDLKVVS